MGGRRRRLLGRQHRADGQHRQPHAVRHAGLGDRATSAHKLLGPLTLNASTAANSLTFQNGIDLNGGARSLVANANTVYLSGAISDSVGGGSLTKTGTATLNFSGSPANTYSGATTILGGDVYLNRSLTSGYTIPGDLYLGGNTQIFVNVQQNNQIAPTAKLNWIGSGRSCQEFKLLGHSLTVAGLCSSIGGGSVIENTWNDSRLWARHAHRQQFHGLFIQRRHARHVVWQRHNRIDQDGNGNANAFRRQHRLFRRNDRLARQARIAGRHQQWFCRPRSQRRQRGNAGTRRRQLRLHLQRRHQRQRLVEHGRRQHADSQRRRAATPTPAGRRSAAVSVILAKTSGYAIPGDFTIGNAHVCHRSKPQPVSRHGQSRTSAGTGNPHFEVYGNTRDRRGHLRQSPAA